VILQIYFPNKSLVALVALEHIRFLMEIRVSVQLYLRGKCLETLATLEPVRVVLTLVMLL
jgi:hypothetical protein